MPKRPTPALIAWLKTQTPGGRVSTQLATVLPAVKVTLVYNYNTGGRWVRAPVFQVEVWADDEIVADTLANDLWNVWPDFRGTWAQSHVIGAWTVSEPRPLPDPTTSKARVMFEGAFMIGD